MKKQFSSGVSTVVSQRFSPASFTEGSGNAFAIGFLDWEPDGPDRQRPVFGWILANGDDCRYRYASVSNTVQGFMNAAVTRADDNAWGGLSGGRLFNFVIRPTLVEKIVL